MKNLLYRALTIALSITLLPLASLSEQKIEAIKLGATLTLSGSSANWGRNAQKGIELALEAVNGAGGVKGRNLEVIYEDFGEVDLKAAATGATKLVHQDRVSVLLTQWAEDTEVVWPIAAKEAIVTLSIAAGAKDITRQSPLLFRVSSSDEALVQTAVDHVYSQGKRTLCILAEQTAYFDSVTALAKDIWKERTGKLPFVIDYPSSTADFRSSLVRMRSKKCDAQFLYMMTGNQGVALKQAKEIGFTPLFVGPQFSDDPNVIGVAKDAAEGLRFPKYKRATPEFISLYKKKYGVDPEIPADLAYDAIMILADTMRSHGLDSKSLQQGLLQTANYRGASGSISFDQYGDRKAKEVEILEVRKGKGVPWSEGMDKSENI